MDGFTLWSIAYTRLSATVDGAPVVPDAGVSDAWMELDGRYSIGWMELDGMGDILSDGWMQCLFRAIADPEL